MNKHIMILWLLLAGVAIAADVNEKLLDVYSRVADLQDRLHVLELNQGDSISINKLESQISSLQVQIKSLESQPKQTVANEGLKTSIHLNHVWVIIAGALVMLMQLGFAFVEAGLTRAKNAVHTMTMNLMDYGIGMLAFWAFGFALMFGGVGAIDSLGIDAQWLNTSLGFQIGSERYQILGAEGFFLSGFSTTSLMTFFFFQMVFAATANTICTGTLAERWRFPAFSLSSFFMAGLVYPIFGAWVWGGGWLQKIGYLDFAGSSVVHMAGGAVALVGALAIGARNGKYDANGVPQAIPGHNLPYTFLGTFILAFGWFGFNAGSTLRADGPIGLIVVNTALASATGSIAGLLASRRLFGKPDPTFAANGLLAGLVAVTAGCAYIEPWAAALIGVIAGFLVVHGAVFIEEKLKVDDPVGAIAVHGLNGVWGTLAVGLFATPALAGQAGLFYGGKMLLLVQAIGVLSGLVLFFILGKLLFYFIAKWTPHRASDEEQAEGLDLTELGLPAYNKD